MKTVETKLSAKNIVKIEKMSDGTWMITQSRNPVYGNKTEVKKTPDGTWEVIPIFVSDSKDVTKEISAKEKAIIRARLAPYGGRVDRIIEHSDGSYTVKQSLPYKPPTSSLISHSRIPRSTTYLANQPLFRAKPRESPIFYLDDIETKLPEGEIVDIKKMPDDTWVITQNVEEEPS